MSKKIESASPEVIYGFKAFDQNFQCRGFQFETGQTYTHKGKVELCESGFHFCEDPLHVLSYYPPDSRFARVTATGAVGDSKDKRVAKSITIGEEVLLQQLIEAAVSYRLNLAGDAVVKDAVHSGAATASGDRGAATASGDSGAATASGYRGAATASGDSGAATASGDSGAATASGDSGAATASGDESCAVSLGYEGKAKASLGSWITVSEWKYTDKWHRIDVQTAKVDGEIILADTFYMLSGGKFIKA